MCTGSEWLKSVYISVNYNVCSFDIVRSDFHHLSYYLLFIHSTLIGTNIILHNNNWDCNNVGCRFRQQESVDCSRTLLSKTINTSTLRNYSVAYSPIYDSNTSPLLEAEKVNPKALRPHYNICPIRPICRRQVIGGKMYREFQKET